VKGLTVNKEGDHVIKPFGKLSLDMLPKNLKQTFKTQWTPLFKFLEPATQEMLSRDFDTISEDDLEATHNCCVEYLQGRVSYCWNTKRGINPLKYSIGTWSNRTSRASITKYGTDEDKKKLQAPSTRNTTKKTGLKRTQQSVKPNVLYPIQKKQRQEMTGVEGGRRQEQARNKKRNPSTATNPPEEEIGATLDAMIASIARPEEDLEAARAMMAANLSELDRGARNVRRAGTDDDGINFFVAPTTGARAASSTDANYVETVRATLEDGISRGRCSVNPCTNPTLPLHRKCDGKHCSKFVHRACAFKKTGVLLMFGTLGDADERVYGCRDCKPLQGSRRVGQLKAPPPASVTTAMTADVTPPPPPPPTRVREERGGKFFGHCSIIGCSYPEQQVDRHHCSKCGAETHNLCAQNNNLCDDDREHLMYCSTTCKQYKQL
jgi:hypothetical protein